MVVMVRTRTTQVLAHFPSPKVGWGKELEGDKNSILGEQRKVK